MTLSIPAAVASISSELHVERCLASLTMRAHVAGVDQTAVFQALVQKSADQATAAPSTGSIGMEKQREASHAWIQEAYAVVRLALLTT